ncbi:MAG: hypothetical protein COT15_00275 [Candidatus Diapherotrites archaeon CG08_land_8_20_14_0_20_34_12]|nr:MAG: hypothetical protein COT15_00275 [Candidatus Diapherotrites archaeon CG08_land_8_20_14_0_20_34_12]
MAIRLKKFRKEKYGFEFAEFGFAGTHVHLAVNVPEKYSILTTKTMLKSWSAKRVFKEKPNFCKLYPRGSFWFDIGWYLGILRCR